VLNSCRICGGGQRESRGATVHKRASKIPTWLLYLQPINSIKHQWRHHLGFCVFIVPSSMVGPFVTSCEVIEASTSVFWPEADLRSLPSTKVSFASLYNYTDGAQMPLVRGKPPLIFAYVWQRQYMGTLCRVIHVQHICIKWSLLFFWLMFKCIMTTSLFLSSTVIFSLSLEHGWVGDLPFPIAEVRDNVTRF
jgi:hypothetical protein